MADATRRVLDENGEVISAGYIAGLRNEISAVSSIQGRPPFQGHLAFGIDPLRLASIIRAADNGVTLEWMILAEEIEELFSHYGAVLAKRKRQVCELPVNVVTGAASQQHADFIKDWLETDALADAMFDITDAIGKGYSVHEIIWETEPGRIVPREFCYRPQRFFELWWQDGHTILLRTATGDGFMPLPAHKFLVHKHRSKSGSVVRSGLTRMVAFLWMYATYTQKDWALFCQAYGLPIRLGRYGPEASDQDKRVLWRAVSSIAGDVAAIIPKSMEMEFVKDTDNKAGSELYLKRLDWFNLEVSKIVLGSTAGTEAINGGHAVGKEHRASEQDVERYDARLLSVTMTRHLIKPIIAFNFGPQVKYPRIVIGHEDKVSLNDLITGVTAMGALGLRVKADEIRDRLDLTKPEDKDEIVGGSDPSPDATPKIPTVPVPEDVSAQGQTRWLDGVLTLLAEAPPEMVELLTQRLAEDAAAAMDGLSSRVKAQFQAATDQADLVHRLHALKLPSGELAEALARGMALAQLVGQASVVAELGRRA